MPIVLDHIAIALWKVSDAPAVLGALLGGVPAGGGPGMGYRGGQWAFQDGARIESIEPAGPPGGFLHRFLERHGPGIHHVTFKVPSLREACTRAERHGYRIVGYEDRDPYWKEAFLHPKQALGIVVQLAETQPAPEGADSWKPGWIELSGLAKQPVPVRVLGLRMSAADAAQARRQWSEVLHGECSEKDAELIFEWPDSPLRIAVSIDPRAVAGPIAIEIRAGRPLAFDERKHPELGTRFIDLDR